MLINSTLQGSKGEKEKSSVVDVQGPFTYNSKVITGKLVTAGAIS